MPVITYSLPIELSSLDVTGGDITIASPSHIRISGAGFQENYYGSFVFSGFELSGGTVTGADLYLDGQKAYEITGGSFPAMVLLGYVEAGDMLGLTNYIFAGSDTVNGSTGADTLAGFFGADQLYGNEGADSLMGGPSNDFLDGGEGQDTAVYLASSARQILTKTASGWQLDASRGGEGIDELVGMELIEFADRTVDLRGLEAVASMSSEEMGQLLELYIANFNRAPDAEGFRYWADRVQQGMSVQDVARSFFDQPESTARYPADQTAADFVTAVYNNVLDRAPDSDGLAYWVDELTNGIVHRAEFTLAIINAAHSPSGGATDASLLNNKKAIGLAFAVEKGLNDLGRAEAVMALVDDSASSVASATAQVDLAFQEALATGDSLLIQLVGASDVLT